MVIQDDEFIDQDDTTIDTCMSLPLSHSSNQDSTTPLESREKFEKDYELSLATFNSLGPILGNHNLWEIKEVGKKMWLNFDENFAAHHSFA